MSVESEELTDALAEVHEGSNPAPLGLVGFGLTTVILSLVNAGLLAGKGEWVVVPLAMAFGGTIQMFAGLLEYKEGNTFGSTAFTSYGAFWWWFGLLLIFHNTGLIPAINAATLGATLIMWGVFTFYMWIGTFKLNWALFSVFFTLWITFLLLGFGDLLGINSLVISGGWIGLLCGLTAMYTSAAEVINWCFDKTVVPIGKPPLE